MKIRNLKSLFILIKLPNYFTMLSLIYIVTRIYEYDYLFITILLTLVSLTNLLQKNMIYIHDCHINILIILNNNI